MPDLAVKLVDQGLGFETIRQEETSIFFQVKADFLFGESTYARQQAQQQTN